MRKFLMAGLLLLLVVAGVLAYVAGSSAPAAPQRAQVAVDVALPVDEAWRRLEDFSVAHRYVPNLERTEITTAQAGGVGASRRVYDGPDSYLEETVVEWRDGEGFELRLHRGDEPMAPFQRAHFRYQLAPAGLEQTRVTLTLEVVMPGGEVGHWLGERVLLPVMAQQLVAVAAGLKHYYETGTPAGDAEREWLAGAVTVVSAPATAAP